MATIRLKVDVDGKGAHAFTAVYTQRMLPRLDNYNVNLAARLTRQAKVNLEASILRPQERDSRPHQRLTGRLTGRRGHAAIRGNALNRGTTPSGNPRQGKGVGWPNLEILHRRARHWRSLEYGTPFVTMPRGFFLRDGRGVPPSARTSTDVFTTFRDAFKGARLRTGTTPLTGRQRRARSRVTGGSRGHLVGRDGTGGPIEAKFFLTNAWNEIVGPRGEIAFAEHVKIIADSFSGFRTR